MFQLILPFQMELPFEASERVPERRRRDRRRRPEVAVELLHDRRQAARRVDD